VLATAVVASVGAAALFYHFVELPSQRLSSSVRYSNRRRVGAAVAAIAVAVVHGD